MQANSSLLSIPERTAGREYHLMIVVGIAHAMSHYAQLVLAMLSSMITVYFGVDMIHIGFVITTFYVTSCLAQAISGFIVDKIGARPVMYFGLIFMILGLAGYALSVSYWMLFPAAIVLGMGTGIFHPTDYTLLNKLISSKRLGQAYSVHGITGNIGWALTPITVVPIATFYNSWQAGVWAAALLIGIVLLVMVFNFNTLNQDQYEPKKLIQKSAKTSQQENTHSGDSGSTFGFMKLPIIWMCMLFFFFYAVSNSAIQSFSKNAVQGLFGLETNSAAICVTFYMLGSGVGMFWGGYLASVPSRCEKIVAIAFSVSAVIALVLAFAPLNSLLVYAMFILMGFFTGTAGPSRDLIVKRSTPAGASGRVFGVVYAGMDVGQAAAPLLYAPLIDQQYFSGFFIALAVVEVVLVASVFNVKRSDKKQERTFQVA